MKYAWAAVLLIFIGADPHRRAHVDATCVLASDFGFTLNCAFKKSSLFRVRNLGGIKAHVGLGFTVGDELGFPESLSNVEGNRRRSASAKTNTGAAKENRIVVRNSPPPSQTARRMMTPVAAPQPIKVDSIQQAQLVPPKPTSSLVPAFKPIPPAENRPVKPSLAQIKLVHSMGVPDSIPNFHSMPASISRVYSVAQPTGTNTINSVSTGEKMSPVKPAAMAIVVPADTIAQVNKNIQNQILANTVPRIVTPSVSMPTLNTSTLSSIEAGILLRQQQLKEKIAAQATSTTTTAAPTTLLSFPIRVSPPTKKYPLVGPSKVMNAPKEYYPVGYDKNFDDNFVSRVELPDTSFYCGDQKHFPGLYADEDLGCMVFHVCALTDDGLIMKSFLCPESTLFDQTILKCNWWFYVDCKNSKNLYDSNIPISKSYQLMKALTFFSSFKKDASKNSTDN